MEIDSNNNVSRGYSTELDSLQQVFSSKQRELKDAVCKVETLRQQLEQLHRRRKLAQNAAVAMANRMQQEAALRPAPPPPTAPPPPCRVAAVEPYHIMSQKSLYDANSGSDSADNGNSECGNSCSQNATVDRFIASTGYDTVLQTVNETLEKQAQLEKSPSIQRKEVVVTLADTVTTRTSANVHMVTKAGSPSDESTSSTSSTSSHSSIAGVGQSVQPLATSTHGEGGRHHRSRRTGMMDNGLLAEQLARDAPPPDLIPMQEKTAGRYGLFTAQPTSASDNLTPPPPSDTAVMYKKSSLDSDVLHIRNDNLRAAKRRSWTEPVETTNDEATHIRLLLKKEQQRGRSHINFGFIFNQLSDHQHPSSLGQVREEQPETQSEETKPKTTAEPEIRPPPPYQQQVVAAGPILTPPKTLMVVPPPYSLVAKQPATPQDSGSSDTSDLDSNRIITLVEVDPEQSMFPRAPKGILREPRSRSRRTEEYGNIRFDPLALLLDAALEGELDLVKESADMIKDVSTCTDEGITALHNAICAGHYDIVRFLVDRGADVNAQDSEGWTPLHCAASCNNLPVVKCLVERGACVFATTLSDLETPADKCERDEDGFEQCSAYLLRVQERLGRQNEGRVFAAYDYEAENDDELSFVAGQSLVVLHRDGDAEKHWWWCRHESSNASGYVARNYLALHSRFPPSSEAGDSPMDMTTGENKQMDTNNPSEINNNNVNSVEIEE